jgi:hypothetical protein
VKILGNGMNLRLVFAIVFGATAFAMADATSVANKTDKKSGSSAKPFKKMDAATKEKWEKDKQKFEAKRAEDKRKDFAEMDAKLSSMRDHSPHGKRSASVDAKSGVSQKDDGKKPHHKLTAADSGNSADEKFSKLIQKDEVDSKSGIKKDMEGFKKSRKDSEVRRTKMLSDRQASKTTSNASPLLEPEKISGK